MKVCLQNFNGSKLKNLYNDMCVNHGDVFIGS